MSLIFLGLSGAWVSNAAANILASGLVDLSLSAFQALDAISLLVFSLLAIGSIKKDINTTLLKKLIVCSNGLLFHVVGLFKHVGSILKLQKYRKYGCENQSYFFVI